MDGDNNDNSNGGVRAPATQSAVVVPDDSHGLVTSLDIDHVSQSSDDNITLEQHRHNTAMHMNESSISLTVAQSSNGNASSSSINMNDGHQYLVFVIHYYVQL